MPKRPSTEPAPSVFLHRVIVEHGMTTDEEGIDSVKRAVTLAQSRGSLVIGCTACKDFDVLTSNKGRCEFCGIIKRGE